MEKRIGTILIVFEDRNVASEINAIIGQFGDCIISRQGIPNFETNHSIVNLIVHAHNDEIGAMAGKLGRISGVSVKSAVIKFENKETNYNKL